MAVRRRVRDGEDEVGCLSDRHRRVTARVGWGGGTQSLALCYPVPSSNMPTTRGDAAGKGPSLVTVVLWWYRYACFIVAGAVVAIVDLYIKHFVVTTQTFDWRARVGLVPPNSAQTLRRDQENVLRGVDYVGRRRTAIVTGGSVGGIGFFTALAFARAGMDVVLTCRTREKGAKAVRSIIDVLRQQSGTVAGDGWSSSVEYELCDLADLRSIASFAATVAHRDIAVCVCNAGAMARPAELTTQGFEAHVGVHVLGHAWLLHLLFGEGPLATCRRRFRQQLTSSAGPVRLVVVGSAVAEGGQFDERHLRRFNDVHELEAQTAYDRFRAYACAKHGSNMLGLALADCCAEAAAANSGSVTSPASVEAVQSASWGPTWWIRPDAGVESVVTLHPGPVKSQVMPNSGPLPLQWLVNGYVTWALRITPEESSSYVFSAAVSDEVEEDEKSCGGRSTDWRSPSATPRRVGRSNGRFYRMGQCAAPPPNKAVALNVMSRRRFLLLVRGAIEGTVRDASYGEGAVSPSSLAQPSPPLS